LYGAYAARALAYENLGDLESAAADLDVVIPQAAEPATFLEKRGQWRLALGRPGDALADFEAAMFTGHASVDVMTGRAVALRQLGSHAASLEALTAAVERYPEAVVARTHRATALFAVGENAAARADLDRIIEHSPDHWKAPVAFSIRAVLRLQDGDRVGAVADMEQAIARSHGTPPTEWIRLLAEIRQDLQGSMDDA
jgi:tetratricopeptide (TPR) repeat protein